MRSIKQELLALLRKVRKKIILIFPLFSKVKKKKIGFGYIGIRPTEREQRVCACVGMYVCVCPYLFGGVVKDKY